MLVRNVDPLLEQIIMRSLSADPDMRPASAASIADALTTVTRTTGTAAPGVTPSHRGGRRRTFAAAAAAAVIVMLAGVAAWFGSLGGGGLTERDTIVIADFQNATDEPVFDGALKVALAVALEQSPFLKVFPDDRARETLRLMQRPPDERITPAVAREIARRAQLKALLAGSIASLGENYVLTIEAINAENGEVMAREQAEARGKELVLTELGAAASRLRQKLGESLASIQKFDVPLPQATTASIDALHAYALALPDGREVPRLEAVPHLKRAIELDPSFALAHAQLSGVYTNTGQSALAPQYSRRAFELRDRVSERERFFISWRYYRDAVQDTDKALELARSWTATYSEGGVRVQRPRRRADPGRALRRVDRAPPRGDPSRSEVLAGLLEPGRLAVRARQVRRCARHPAAGDRRRPRLQRRPPAVVPAGVRAGRRADDGARAEGVARRQRETNAAYGWQAHTFAFAGRTAEAHQQFRQGIELARQGNFPEVAAQLAVEDAEVHAIVGQCAVARTEAAEGLAGSRDNETLERASRALALCGASSEAQELLRELARRFPESTLTNRIAIPVATAILALNRRDAAARRSGAGAGQAIRPCPFVRIVVPLPAWAGVPPAARRQGRGGAVPGDSRSPRRGAGLDALRARARRAGAGGRPRRQHRRRRAGTTNRCSRCGVRPTPRRSRCSTRGWNTPAWRRAAPRGRAERGRTGQDR